MQNKRSERSFANIFFGVCPRQGSYGQYDQAWQIRIVRVLWADVDDGTPEEAVDRCKTKGLPEPSIVVASGKGGHLYWLLAEPILIDDGDQRPVFTEFIDQGEGKKKKPRKFLKDITGEKLWLDINHNVPDLSAKAQHVQDILAGIAAKIGGDHTTDLSRLLRIPGTLNRKDQRNGREPVPCRLLEFHPDRRYLVELFAPLAKESPDRQRRETIAKVKLPTHRRLGPKGKDKFHDLLLACEAAEVGTRSEVDYKLCCWAIEHGVTRDEVWTEAQRTGKFAEAGERYFDRTWDKAEEHAREHIYNIAERRATRGNAKPSSNGHAANDSTTSKTGEPEQLSNAIIETETDDDGKEKTVTTPRPMAEVVNLVFECTAGDLRRIEKALFAHSSGMPIDWIDSTFSLFGYLQTRVGIVEWRHGAGFVTKEETFCELQRQAPSFVAVEPLPHWPPIKGHFYTCPIPSPGDGRALAELIEMHSLETGLDRELTFAFYATAIWGGPPGTRPAFLVTATKGRGKGKSIFCQHFARTFGGQFDVNPQEDFGKIKERLLSPQSAGKRLATIDNLKTTRFSWGEFENLITADTINGKIMYVGDGSRPNLLTWTITLNGASLSTDMAQRVVEIHLQEPTYSETWEEQVAAFIDANREKIIADCIAFLQRPAKRMKPHSRWATWESQVLSKVDHPDDCLALILQRRGAVDVEAEEGEIIEDHFAQKLTWLGYNPDRDDVFIPNQIVVRWFNEATGDTKKATGVTRALNQLHDEDRVSRIIQNRSGDRTARGFRWVGEHADAIDVTHYDIRERLADKAKDWQQTT